MTDAIEQDRGDERHCDRCWLTPAEKRERRQVTPDQIGLETKAPIA